MKTITKFALLIGMILIAMPLANAWPSNLNVGLVSYYDFEQTSGHLLDQVGTGSSTAETITNRNAVGIVSRGWFFEWGNNDVLTMSTSELNHVDANDARTISGWLKPETTIPGGGSNVPYGYGTAGDNQKWVFLLICSGDLIRIDTQNANCQLSIPCADFIKAGQWELYTVTYNTTDCKFYRNNTLLGISTMSATPNTATTSFEIGRGLSVNENHINGTLDEMGIWNRELTASEVNQLWNGGNGITIHEIGPFFNTSYAHYKILNISANSFILNSSTINLTMDTASLIASGKMQSNCSDLRVIYKNIELDRVFGDYGFLEGIGCNKTNTNVYFMVKDNITASTLDYRIWYGNSTVENPPSSADNVFLLYEDCSNINDWSDVTQITTDGKECHTDAAQLGTMSKPLYGNVNYSLQSYVYRYKTKMVGGGGSYFDSFIGSSNAITAPKASSYQYRIYRTAGDNWNQIIAPSNVITKAQINSTLTTNNTFRRYTGGNWDGWIDNGQKLNWSTTNLTDNQILTARYALIYSNAAQDINFTDVLIMGVSDANPTLTLGNEQPPPVPPSLPNITAIWINSTSPSNNFSVDNVIGSFVCSGENDPLNYNISWVKNDAVQFAYTGKSVANNTQKDETLNAGNLTVGDNWLMEIECCDNSSNCIIANSSKIYIKNSINIPSIWINSTEPSLNDTTNDLVGSFVCLSENISTNLGYNIGWLRNNVTMFAYVGSVNNNTISNNVLKAGNLTIGDQWRFQVNCADDVGSITRNSSELEILFWPPVLSNLYMNTTNPAQNTTLDNSTVFFKCTSPTVTNPYYAINWTINGNIVNVTEGLTTSGIINDIALQQQNFWYSPTSTMRLRKGDIINATVTCFQNKTDMAALNSSTITSLIGITILSNGLSVGPNATIKINGNEPLTYAYPNSTLSANVTVNRSVPGEMYIYFTWFRGNGSGIPVGGVSSWVQNLSGTVNISSGTVGTNNVIIYAPVNITQLRPNEHWMIRVNASGSPWSEEANATIDVLNYPLRIPIIALPVNGTIVINGSVEVVCNGTTNATGGNLSVYGDAIRYEFIVENVAVTPALKIRQNTSSTSLNLNIGNLNRSNEKWYIMCRANDGINESGWAGIANFTVDNIPLYGGVTTQVSPVFVSTVNPFIINVSWNTNMLSGISTMFNYNHVQYLPTTTTIINSTLTQYSISLTAPDQIDVNWFWNITMAYNAGASGPLNNISYNGTQHTTNWTLVPMANHSLCLTPDGKNGTVIINFTLADEQNRIVKFANNGTIGLDLDYYLDTASARRNIIYVNNTNEVALCLNNVSVPYILFTGAVAYGDQYPAPLQYDNRFYYLCRNNYSNYTHEINLYQLNISSSAGIVASQVTFTVLDSYGTPKVGEIIQANRHDIGETPDLLVAMGKTDTAGQAMLWLDKTGETMYGYNYYSPSTCELDKNVNATALWSATINENIADPNLKWTEIDNINNAVNNIQNNSNSCLFSYYNNSQEIDEMCLRVDAFQGSAVYTILDYCTTSLASGVNYNYIFPNTTTDITYTCSMYLRSGSNYAQVNALTVTYSNSTNNPIKMIRQSMGKEGLFAVLLLVGILAFAMIGNTTAVIIAVVFGIVAAYILGLISFVNPVTVIIGLIVVGLILVWRLQKSE